MHRFCQRREIWGPNTRWLLSANETWMILKIVVSLKKSVCDHYLDLKHIFFLIKSWLFVRASCNLNTKSTLDWGEAWVTVHTLNNPTFKPAVISYTHWLLHLIKHHACIFNTTDYFLLYPNLTKVQHLHVKIQFVFLSLWQIKDKPRHSNIEWKKGRVKGICTKDFNDYLQNWMSLGFGYF